jgi:hypothetical protein
MPTKDTKYRVKMPVDHNALTLSLVESVIFRTHEAAR